ncbi:MAG: type II toxin-antitoxin system VapC family toxin [Thermoplasmata archaeon]|nr:MAG: type II toxin-antitoxin system VapC family toxin [Thermoplasmata archaeon]
MVGVDTTFLIDLFRGDKKALVLMEKLSREEEHISTTVINIAELYRGAYLHKDKERKLREIKELETLLIILDMRIESAKIYGKLYSFLKEKGRITNDRDILIAAIFLSYGENRIVTRDRKHFQQIEGLHVISY